MKKFLLVFCMLSLSLSLLSCAKSYTEPNSTQEQVSKGDILAKELADKYQATTGWDKNLDYTLQAQERLITGKPILFRGTVDDVFKRDGKTFIRFASSFWSQADYVLELECSQQVIDKLFSQESDGTAYLKKLDEYAIVANIQEVSKPVVALEPIGTGAGDDESVDIAIEPSDLFIAKGTCVDIVHIGP
jgi:hypothetical protein